jgi:hypothetical protein
MSTAKIKLPSGEWEYISVGPPGPPGPPGSGVVTYNQPDEPVDAPPGAIWMDTDEELTLPEGPEGPSGPPGVGVPAGGSSGMVLSKTSATDYATTWIVPPGGDGADFPAGGTAGFALVKLSGTTGDVGWDELAYPEDLDLMQTSVMATIATLVAKALGLSIIRYDGAWPNRSASGTTDPTHIVVWVGGPGPPGVHGTGATGAVAGTDWWVG